MMGSISGAFIENKTFLDRVLNSDKGGIFFCLEEILRDWLVKYIKRNRF
jgi:hypothetical protein